MFENAKWIWNPAVTGTDCYAEFYTSCELDGNAPIQLRISADSNYAVYVNGRFASSGQYADFPYYKVYDEVDLSRFVVTGVNHLAIIVWYYGISSFTYSIGRPGLLFEVEQNGAVVLSSNEAVRSRKSKRYISNRNETITTQMGLNFHVDLREENDWQQGKDLQEFGTSVIREDMPKELFPREIKKLTVEPGIPMHLAMQGSFAYPPDGEHAGDLMQRAALMFHPYEAADGGEDALILKREGGEGVFFLVDLKQETAGYLDFELDVPTDCRMEVGWGEHLEDGRCRTKIAERNFSVIVDLKRGKNSYMNPFRRFGCRYVQFFIHADEVSIHYAGIRPTTYPVKMLEYKSENLLRNEIYTVCQHTLLQCMHEHYEDCPWREQSFYSLDSRNQMLCGYYAFAEYEFPRACLRLMSRAIREDGLLPMCCPTDDKLVIPSFVLSHIISVAEYYRHTKDKETVEFCFDSVKRIADTFISRMDETGLIPNFDEKKDYWNFYEWQPYLNGRMKHDGKAYDMCLNALFSYTLDSLEEICEVMENKEYPCRQMKQALNESIVRELYDEEAGLFRIYRGQEDAVYSVLANALGCLCGAADQLDSERMVDIIQKNKAEEESIQVIPATLSMHTFRYDALLSVDKERYRKVILDEIDRVYFHMLREGATSFWETEKGAKDFSGAGSLCHGWSAMPVYYYKTLITDGGECGC